MKGVWKHLKMLPVIVYPYLYMVAACIVFIVALVEDNTTQSYEYTMLSIVIAVFSAVFVTLFCLLLAIFNSIRSGKNAYGTYYPTRMNLMIKCIQIPAYVINFVIGMLGIVMSLWGIGFIALAVIVDFLTISISGTNNVGTCVNLYKTNVLTKGKAVLFSVLSYVYVVDVFVAIYLFIQARKNRIRDFIKNNIHNGD